MKKIALITNYNIPEKLSAAERVAQRLVGKVENILIPASYKDRIFQRVCTEVNIATKRLTTCIAKQSLL